ncbi:hypothetical protein C5167_006891, partial [Papaver somniferum]
MNGIFRRNSILAYFDDPRYRRNGSGITKYETLEMHSIVKKEDFIEYRRAKEFRQKYQNKVDRFFFIPGEVHILSGSSSTMVRNNSIIGIDTRITLNIRSRVGGLVRKNWIYVQRITPIKKKFFVLVRPVVTYEIADGINLTTLFPHDLLQERDNVQLRVVNYIFYGNGKPIRGIYHTSIQLVRTCLVLNWNQEKKGSSIEEVQASFVEVRVNNLIRYFIRVDLVKSLILYTRKRNDRPGGGLIWIPDNGSDRTILNPFSFYSKARIQQTFTQHQGTIRAL